ncbi:sorting nexin-8-like [Amblyomma americanum]
MTVDLSVGAVPALYKEVHSLLNPSDKNEIDRELFSRLLASTNLPKTTLDQVWEYAGARQGPVTATSLYKSLALVAIAQQGRLLDEKSLLNLEVLPNPSLASPAELREKLGLSGRKAMSLDLKSGGSDPRILNTNYEQMVAQDTIRVALVPEKKGIILKHVVYEVSSQRYQSRVERRYNDFVTLFDILVQRFPYRAVPQLPPKRAMADSHFIEERRRALRRFLTLVARHPVLGFDKAVSIFLTFSGTDVQTRLKEYCKNVPDEFLTSDVARRPDELVSTDTTVQFAVVREQLRQVYICLSQLREAAQRMVDRSKMSAVDILVVGREFATLSNISKLESDWATGGNDAWNIVQKALRSLQSFLVPIHEAHSEQSLHEEEEVLEELNLFLDLLVAYKALCDRHESGVVLGHHKAINRMVKKSSNSFGAVDPMKQAQELEHRTQFSLHCVHLESQMVYAHMEALGGITRALVRIQANGHAKLAALWSGMAPAVAAMVPNAGTPVPR